MARRASRPRASHACRAGERPRATAEGATAEPVAAAGCYNQPRFFPVPTRPVFSARADLSCPPIPPGVIRQPEGLPETGGTMPIEGRPSRSVPSKSAMPEPELRADAAGRKTVTRAARRPDRAVHVGVVAAQVADHAAGERRETEPARPADIQGRLGIAAVRNRVKTSDRLSRNTDSH